MILFLLSAKIKGQNQWINKIRCFNLPTPLCLLFLSGTFYESVSCGHLSLKALCPKMVREHLYVNIYSHQLSQESKNIRIS